MSDERSPGLLSLGGFDRGLFVVDASGVVERNASQVELEAID